MEKKPELKGYEKAYLFAQRIINSCDDLEHIRVCKNLIDNFKRTYKKYVTSDKELNNMAAELTRILDSKKNAVRFRKHYEKTCNERSRNQNHNE